MSTVWKGSTRGAPTFLNGSRNASPAPVPQPLLAITSSIHPSPCHRVREADCREGEQTDVMDLVGGHVHGQRPASVRTYGTLCLRADRRGL